MNNGTCNNVLSAPKKTFGLIEMLLSDVIYFRKYRPILISSHAPCNVLKIFRVGSRNLTTIYSWHIFPITPNDSKKKKKKKSRNVTGNNNIFCPALSRENKSQEWQSVHRWVLCEMHCSKKVLSARRSFLIRFKLGISMTVDGDFSRRSDVREMSKESPQVTA